MRTLSKVLFNLRNAYQVYGTDCGHSIAKCTISIPNLSEQDFIEHLNINHMLVGYLTMKNKQKGKKNLIITKFKLYITANNKKI